jgi:copper(I)-binding protein
MRRNILLLAVCLLTACSGESDAPLLATDVIVTRPVPGTQISAGYLQLTNNTQATITINRVTSPDFASVEMHESLLENGIARMRALRELSIPANQTIHFERGGKHLMLMRPGEDINEVTLHFFSGDTLLLSIVAEPERAAE